MHDWELIASHARRYLDAFHDKIADAMILGSVAGDLRNTLNEVFPPADTPAQAPTLEVDGDAGAWYIRLLNEPVARTTEQPGPVNVDWANDGRMVGVELLGAESDDLGSHLVREGFALNAPAQARVQGDNIPVILSEGGQITDPDHAEVLGLTVDAERLRRAAQARESKGAVCHREDCGCDQHFRPVAEPSTEDTDG